MALDPKAKALLTAIEVAGEPAITELPLDVSRMQIERAYARMKIPLKPVASVQNMVIPAPCEEILIRIYTPSGTGPFPVIVFFHGGGWVLFHPDSYDPVCTHLCEGAECIVVSVDYRLAPENKFPAATDDCLAANRWIFENCTGFNGDQSRVFVAGDSAGGNLAAVTALRIRDEGGPKLMGQVLIYPILDYYLPEKKSYTEFSDGFGLNREVVKWYWDQYLDKKGDRQNPYAAPLLAQDLSALPGTLVIVSGYDPLRDDGIAYANRLLAAGVQTRLSIYEDMIHGFISYPGILKQAKTAIEEISIWIRKKEVR